MTSVKIVEAVCTIIGLGLIFIFLHSCDVQQTKRLEIRNHTITPEK